MVTKRKLPVLPSTATPPPAPLPPEEDDETRPPWQWIGFGTAAIFGAWLPLAYLGEAMKARALRAYVGAPRDLAEAQSALAELTSSDRTKLTVLTALLYVAPLLVGAYAGGFLVGKWGGRAGVREAALSGVATALVASALSWASAGLSWAPLVALALATPAAALGGRAGVRRRAPE